GYRLTTELRAIRHIDRRHLWCRDASGFFPNNFPVSRLVWWRQEGMSQWMRGAATAPLSLYFRHARLVNGYSKPFTVRAGRRSVPEQACRPVVSRGRVFVAVYNVYVYRTLAFSRVRGGFVDSRHCRQHKDQRRPTALGSRRHVSPGSLPGL